MEGYVARLHRSPYHGFSIEFAEHREYTPGDDIRHIRSLTSPHVPIIAKIERAEALVKQAPVIWVGEAPYARHASLAAGVNP